MSIQMPAELCAKCFRLSDEGEPAGWGATVKQRPAVLLAARKGIPLASVVQASNSDQTSGACRCVSGVLLYSGDGSDDAGSMARVKRKLSKPPASRVRLTSVNTSPVA